MTFLFLLCQLWLVHEMNAFNIGSVNFVYFFLLLLLKNIHICDPFPLYFFFSYGWGKKIDQLTDLGQVNKQDLLGFVTIWGELTSLIRRWWAPAFLQSATWGGSFMRMRKKPYVVSLSFPNFYRGRRGQHGLCLVPIWRNALLKQSFIEGQCDF